MTYQWANVTFVGTKLPQELTKVQYLVQTAGLNIAEYNATQNKNQDLNDQKLSTGRLSIRWQTSNSNKNKQNLKVQSPQIWKVPSHGRRSKVP